MYNFPYIKKLRKSMILLIDSLFISIDPQAHVMNIRNIEFTTLYYNIVHNKTT